MNKTIYIKFGIVLSILGNISAAGPTPNQQPTPQGAPNQAPASTAPAAPANTPQTTVAAQQAPQAPAQPAAPNAPAPACVSGSTTICPSEIREALADLPGKGKALLEKILSIHK